MKNIKNTFSKYSSLIFVILIICSIYFFSSQKNTSNNKESTISSPSFNNFSEVLGVSVINCEFKVFSKFTFSSLNKDELIKYGTSNQKQPVSIVFSGLDTKTPIMKGNNGEDPLLILPGTENEINLASFNSNGDMFMYKIYKKQKLATWYKSYDMFGSPYTVLSMGYCY